MELIDLLRSVPALVSGMLAHVYLENKLLRLGEPTAASLFQESPEILAEMNARLREVEDDFVDGYDPSVFVLELRSLQALDVGLRERLLAAVRSAYHARFQPEVRLQELREASAAFLIAFQTWHDAVIGGVTSQSTSHWQALRQQAAKLRDLLQSPDLSTRWIP